MRGSAVLYSLLVFASILTEVDAFLPQYLPMSHLHYFERNAENLFTQKATDTEEIEPYVGPVGNIADMEGGIAVGKINSGKYDWNY